MFIYCTGATLHESKTDSELKFTYPSLDNLIIFKASKVLQKYNVTVIRQSNVARNRLTNSYDTIIPLAVILPFTLLGFVVDFDDPRPN